MKKLLAGLLVLMMAMSLCLFGLAETKYAWYFPAAHSYGEEVKGFAEKFAQDEGVEVKFLIGSDWEQSTEDANIRALVADGYMNISAFPSSDGAAGLYDELKSFGANIVGYGASTSQQTELFCIATDVQAAAYDACKYVIEAMGGKGGILNVLEVLSDTNTLKRKAGVEACINDTQGVELVQQVADITSIAEGVEKISAAVTSNAGKIQGIVCTGNQSSAAAVQVLDDYFARNPNAERIYLVCIDTPDDVMKGIKNDIVYGTIAQNTYAHGYIPMLILKMLNEGYSKVDGTYFIDSGCVLVTKDNMETFSEDLMKVTNQIIDDLPIKYLKK
jgi:ribose transport system substrate-binding protein